MSGPLYNRSPVPCQQHRPLTSADRRDQTGLPLDLVLWPWGAIAADCDGRIAGRLHGDMARMCEQTTRGATALPGAESAPAVTGCLIPVCRTAAGTRVGGGGVALSPITGNSDGPLVQCSVCAPLLVVCTTCNQIVAEPGRYLCSGGLVRIKGGCRARYGRNHPESLPGWLAEYGRNHASCWVTCRKGQAAKTRCQMSR